MLCSNALESNAREACAIIYIYIYIYIYIDALSTELKCMQETAIRETKGVLIREVSSFLGVLERGVPPHILLMDGNNSILIIPLV